MYRLNDAAVAHNDDNADDAALPMMMVLMTML